MTPPTRLVPAVADRALIPPFHVMDVWTAAGERQRSHGDLVNLSAGQPSTPAPRPVRAAAAAALDREVLGYTVALGVPELRSAIAGHYERRYGLAVPAEQVVVTTGSSGGFLIAFLAAFDVGDRVAMARPGYPCYRNILTALGCEIVELPCGPETRYQPTVAMLEALDEPVRGFVVASPANPTGTVLDPAELAALAQYCERRGIQMISDEIYHGISYAGAADLTRPASAVGFHPPGTSSAWTTSREAIVVNSFSKYFSMTGWRLGWLLLPPRLLAAAGAIAGNFTVCPPAIAQQAALGAFHPESYSEVDAHVARYELNRDVLLAGLPRLGITRVAPPDGAFYVYADVAHLTGDSMSLVYELLADTGVALAPGVDFDPVDGHRWVRISCAGATVDVEEALVRLGGWLASR